MAELIVVSDCMQSHYEYFLTQPVGDCFTPEFQPQLSPRKMLELGVFGGKYMTDCSDEFPDHWYIKARLSPKFHDPEINYFKVNASRSLSYWRDKGWIYSEDPRGWFQWYCRYYMGRRCEDDPRQIKRWKNMRRHIAQLKRNCEPWDLSCRPRQRQALLHWAYDSRNI
ncbi:MAG: hypothetical protein GY727_11510 [Gammaproteobacteria bacterium]|nr:hypothetical protein [Gammaproteobacteria bacterium]MCP4088365.1 hypothetical protein [Gammaproteobacteria bacterium]MCP4275096.1 hypothetical protein [Gammaproteobacteria bacterium]MCP4830971.1 hypothetical protein [Gammaproteobacteria bacterium]MCP4927508.1 hypothetical protein [Gammaproteobacteria bacterium]